jgi:putative membrane protein
VNHDYSPRSRDRFKSPGFFGTFRRGNCGAAKHCHLPEPKTVFATDAQGWTQIVNDQTPEPSDPRVGLARNRTGMASYRTQLALDRSMLAWIRTTLTLATFGFGMVGFFRSLEEKQPTPENLKLHHSAVRMGTSFVILGVVAMVVAGVSHWLTLRRLLRGEAPVLRQWPLSLTLAFLLAIIGMFGLWVLFRH